MGDIFNEDFREFIQALNKYGIAYMLVGGYAVILYGNRRTTGDMDIWVRRTKENYVRLIQAFSEFGLPTNDLTEENFLNAAANDVFTYGRPPVCIDVMTELKGVDFEDAYIQSQIFDDDGLAVRYIHINHLIEAKKAAGRYKDLDDIEKLSPKK